ncbi:hypothetical protein NFI96_029740, partial [Prochilodus magdalenae]
MVQYPAMEPQSNKFTAVSHVRIKPEKGKATTLTCQVNHLDKKQRASTTVQGPTSPTVRLGEIGQSIACIIEDFHPDGVNVKWKKDDQVVQAKDWITKGKSSGLNKAVSVLEANQTASSPGTKYTCEVTHGGDTISKYLTTTAEFSVKVSPPQAKKLFLNSKAVIECIISGENRKEVEAAKVSWTVGGRTTTSGITNGGVTQTGSSFTKTSTLTITESVWFKGDEVMCSASRDQKTISDITKVKKGGTQPSVTIYKPDKSVRDSDTVSLVCEASSSDSADVYIMWQENGGQYMEGNGITTMVKNDKTQIVLSSLTVTGQKYNSAEFACAVKDANTRTDIQPRIFPPAKDNSAPTIRMVESGQSITCIIEDFYPKALTIKWKQNDRDVRGLDWKTTEKESGLYRTVSVLQANLTSSSPGTKYTCEVSHAGRTTSEHLSSKAEFSVKVSPPQAKELFIHSKAVIECVISGDIKMEVQVATVSWTVGGRTQTSGVTHGGVTQTGSSFTKNSTLTIPESVWFKGDEVICFASSGQKSPSDKTTVKIGATRPSITIYKPDKSVNETERVSLVCEVSSSNLQDVYIMWQENGGQYMESDSTTTIKQESTLIVLSTLTVTGQQYNSATFTCAVKDANMENDTHPEKITTSKSKDVFCPPCPLFIVTIRIGTVDKKTRLSKVATLQERAKTSFHSNHCPQPLQVSTAPPSAPVVVSECAPSSDGFLTLGCVASGFFPSSISFSWTDGSGGAVSDMVQYPAMEPESNKFTAVSHVRIKPEKGKTTTLTCQVNHLNKNQSKTFEVPTPPTVHLGEIGQSIACIIEDFHPDAVNVKWKKDDQEVQGKDWITKGKSSGFNKAVSVLETNQTSPGTKYTCEVTHGGKRFTNELTSTAHFSVIISPPQAKELFLNSTAVIDCVISGNDQKEVKEATVSWTVGGQTQTSKITDGVVTQTGPSFTKTSTLTITESAWFSGDEVICSASNGKKTTSKKISVIKGGKPPSVTIYKPDKSVSDSDTVSLVCEVSSSNLGDVYIMWQENGGQFMEGNGMTIMKKDSTLIVLSSLIVSGQKYNDQSQLFGCAVKDAYMKDYTHPRTVTTHKIPTAPPSAPLMVSECAPSSADGFLTLGCVAKDFFPSSISFSWTDGSGVAVTNMVQYPAAETEPNSNKFTAVSHVRIKPENGKTTLTCQVNHLNKTEKTSTVVQGPTPPTVRLGEIGQSIACIIEDFHPDGVNVKWKKDDREVQGKDWITKGKSSRLNKAVSVLETNQTASSPGTKYTCEVRHGNDTITKYLTTTAHFSVKIRPPQAKELFLNNKAVIECIISGENQKEVEGATVSWTVGGRNQTSDITHGGVKQTGSSFTKTSTLTITESSWFSGNEVICSASRDQKSALDKIKVRKGATRPSVTIYKPNKSVKDSDTVSLVCEVSSSDLGDVYIMWQENGGQYMEGNSIPTIKQGSTQVALSYLTVTGKQYNSALFTCSVNDANMESDTQPKIFASSESKAVSCPPCELPQQDPGSYVQCNQETVEEDEFNSLWSTASSFIFLFLFSLVYSTVLSLSKYPAMEPESNKFTAVSHVRIKPEKGKTTLTCQVNHLDKKQSASTEVEGTSQPTIRLLESGQSILCMIEDFYPKALTIKWKKDDREVRGLDWKSSESDSGSYRTVSVLQENLASSSPGTKYTCEVSHRGKTYSAHLSSKAEFSVKISPPQAKELFLNSKAVIECIISGNNRKEVDGATVSWTVGGRNQTSGITHGAVKQTGSLFTKTSTLTIPESVWFSGDVVMCSASRDQNSTSEETRVRKGATRPSITIYKPDKSVSDSDTVSLVCEASSSDSADVYIMWKENGGQYMEGNGMTTMVKNNKTQIVLSTLTVTGQKYNSAEFTCAVKDANTQSDFQPRIFPPPKANSAPTVRLVESGQSIMCIIEDFYPKALTIKWKQDDREVRGLDWKTTEKESGLYRTVSVYAANLTSSSPGTKYTCEVTHGGKPYSEHLSAKAHFSVTISPPKTKELFIHSKAVIECVISGDIKKEVEAAVSWTVGGKPQTSGITHGGVKQIGSAFTKTSTLTIPESVWFSGNEVMCSASSDPTKPSEKIRVRKGATRPSITIYKPDKSVNDTETVSLVCEVSSSDLRGVYIMWQENHGQYLEGNSTTTMMKSDKTQIVLSSLTMTGKQYNSAEFTCAVKDPNMENYTQPTQITTHKSEPPQQDPENYLQCNEDTVEEDEFNSLWSTASSFIFLFLFSLVYSTVLSLSKVKIQFRIWFRSTPSNTAAAADVYSPHTSKSAPSVPVVVSQCGPSCDEFLTYGCIASGFYPADSLTFSWTEKSSGAVRDVVQYPAVMMQDGKFTAVSHVQVPKEWKAKPLTCQVNHDAGTRSTTVQASSPPVLRVEEFGQSIMCIIEDFFPKALTITWKKDGHLVQGLDWKTAEIDLNSNRAVSILNESLASSSPGTTYTCEVIHEGRTYSKHLSSK